jgi:diaminopimelate decarboxylase/aspartate kinase
MAVVARECPVLVYNEELLNDTLFDLLALDSIDALVYPVHVNPHQKILRKVFEMGAGFRCISLDELNRLFTLFPGINPETILLAIEAAAGEDLLPAFHRGVHVLVHDMKMLLHQPGIFQHRPIFLNLGAAGQEAKNVEAILQTLSSLEITIAGFHIAKDLPLSTDRDPRFSSIMGLLGRFSKSPTLILAGKMGVFSNGQKGTIDIPVTGGKLESIKETYPGLTIWFEPGSQVVSRAGVLLTRVVQAREKNRLCTARINVAVDPVPEDIAMGTCYHMVNLSSSEKDPPLLVRVAGRDVTGPVSMKEGDILLFTNMGAYGPQRCAGDQQQTVAEHYLNARKMCPVKL